MRPCTRVDLHTHTTASDGTLSPHALVQQAKAAGLTAIAITDHDTTAAYAEARAEGSRLGVEVIRGVEINTDASEGEFHFLGYLVDDESPAFRDGIRRAQEQRWVRARAIIARLRAAGFQVTEDQALAAANGAPVCRPHIAVALVAAGYAATPHEAYQRYLRSRSPYFVPHTGLTVPEAIATIRGAGGVPILSHPTALADDAVLALRPLGVLGLEVNHPDHSPDVAAHWRAVAHGHGLLATGGSDYHGRDSVEPDRELGAFLAPSGAIEALREAHEQLKRGA